MTVSSRTFVHSDWIIAGGCVVLIAAAAVARFAGAGAVLAFPRSGFAVTLLAALVGRSVGRSVERPAIVSVPRAAWCYQALVWYPERIFTSSFRDRRRLAGAGTRNLPLFCE